MQVFILCGGQGTRMREVTENLPKPLAMIGNRPILWHIMKIYEHYGFNDFVLLLGYKGDTIKEYFMDYIWKQHDFILNGEDGSITLLKKPESWKITFVDTGMETMTGARIKKAEPFVNNETFMVTYGDGLSDINLHKLLTFHKEQGKIATVTGITKKSQYGTLTIEDGLATSFEEKKQIDGIINGGFFVFNRGVFDYLESEDNCILEQTPMKQLVENQQLSVYMHHGFWIAMDTYKDILTANEIWKNSNNKSWKVWME